MLQDTFSADEAQAAKRPRLPSSSAPTPETPMETTGHPAFPTTVAEHGSITSPNQNPQLLSRLSTALQDNSTQMDPETQMDTSNAVLDALREPTLGSDPSSTPKSALNSDPLLSALSPPPPAQRTPDSYTPNSGYVSYMEALLSSHFPQDDGPGPLY